MCELVSVMRITNASSDAMRVLPVEEGHRQATQLADTEGEALPHHACFRRVLLANGRIQLRRGPLDSLKEGKSGGGLGGCIEVPIETKDLRPTGGIKPALDARRPRLGHQGRAGCIERLAKGIGQDGRLEVRTKDRIDGFGGAEGR